MFVQVAKLNAITVLVFSGALAATAVSTVAPVLAPVVAVAYPVVDMAAYERINYPVTRITLLMIASYLPAAAVTLVMLAVSVGLGLVLGPPLAVVRLVSRLRSSGSPTVAVRDVIRLPTPRPRRR